VTTPIESPLLVRLKTIVAIALPVALAMSSQTIVNLFDSAMVGSLGEAPLAAVGQGGYLAIFAGAPFIGLASAVQAFTARRVGEGDKAKVAEPVVAGLLISFVCALPATVALFLVAPYLFPLLNPDPEVVELGVPYFQARVSALVALGVMTSFRGYFTGIARANVYLATQVVVHTTNIGLSICLIFGYFGLPELGVLGAGIGTAASLWLGCLLYLILGFTLGKAHGFSAARPSTETLRAVLGQALPAGVDQTWIFFTHSVMFWIIAQIGTTEVAAATVLMNMVAVTLMPAFGLGVAAATQVGRNLGQKKPEEAYQWAWFVSRVGIVVLGLTGLPMVLAPDAILGLFITDQATIAAGRLPLQLLGAAASVDAIATVLMFALLGSGNAKTVMRWSMALQTVVLVSEYVVGPVLGLGLTAVWACNVVNRFSLAAIFGTIWVQRKWQPPSDATPS